MGTQHNGSAARMEPTDCAGLHCQLAHVPEKWKPVFR
jgi:hypothetical protein